MFEFRSSRDYRLFFFPLDLLKCCSGKHLTFYRLRGLRFVPLVLLCLRANFVMSDCLLLIMDGMSKCTVEHKHR